MAATVKDWAAATGSLSLQDRYVDAFQAEYNLVIQHIFHN